MDLNSWNRTLQIQYRLPTFTFRKMPTTSSKNVVHHKQHLMMHAKLTNQLSVGYIYYTQSLLHANPDA